MVSLVELDRKIDSAEHILEICKKYLRKKQDIKEVKIKKTLVSMTNALNEYSLIMGPTSRKNLTKLAQSFYNDCLRRSDNIINNVRKIYLANLRRINLYLKLKSEILVKNGMYKNNIKEVLPKRILHLETIVHVLQSKKELSKEEERQLRLKEKALVILWFSVRSIKKTSLEKNIRLYNDRRACSTYSLCRIRDLLSKDSESISYISREGFVHRIFNKRCKDIFLCESMEKSKRTEDQKLKREQRRKKRSFIRSLRKECYDCGSKKELNFDHFRGKKEFNIGGCWNNKGWEVIKNELRKCQVVCKSCHAAREFKRGVGHTRNMPPRNIKHRAHFVEYDVASDSKHCLQEYDDEQIRLEKEKKYKNDSRRVKIKEAREEIKRITTKNKSKNKRKNRKRRSKAQMKRLERDLKRGKKVDFEF